MIGPQERTARLKRIAILSSLTEAELEQVARRCKWREYGPGEQVCGYQDAVTDVLFLLAGKARVIIYSAEGKGVVFADLTPSTMFGEIAAIDRKPRSASVEALETCTIASLSASEFESLLRRQPEVALATLRHVT